MKAQKVWCSSPVSFNLGITWWWMFNATPWPLYPRDRHPIPRAGLYKCGKSHPHTRRESLYRLRHPAPSSSLSLISETRTVPNTVQLAKLCTGLFISPSGISELDCATTKTDTAERSVSIGIESLQVFLY